MNAYQLPHLSLFRGCIILRCVHFFLSFSLNYRQMRRDYKITFTDKSKINLWIHLDLAKVQRFKGLTSLCIISYLHFLNLNNILTLSKIFVVAEAVLNLTWIMFALFFCLPDLHACALVYEIKSNASRLHVDGNYYSYDGKRATI